jgi:hypothetical protein
MKFGSFNEMCVAVVELHEEPRSLNSLSSTSSTPIALGGIRFLVDRASLRGWFLA